MLAASKMNAKRGKAIITHAGREQRTESVLLAKRTLGMIFKRKRRLRQQKSNMSPIGTANDFRH